MNIDHEHWVFNLASAFFRDVFPFIMPGVPMTRYLRQLPYCQQYSIFQGLGELAMEDTVGHTALAL